MEGEQFRIREVDPKLLERERDRVLAALREALPFASVLEIGSTAVDGVVGKQDLDLLVRVQEARFEEARSVLDRLFARNDGQLSNQAFQGYTVASPLDLAVQLTVESGAYDDFERFLDLLRNDPDLRRAYNELKLAWNGRSMDGYRAAKDDFIARALARRDAF